MTSAEEYRRSVVNEIAMLEVGKEAVQARAGKAGWGSPR